MVRLIVWIIIALLVLSFLGISLRGLVESPVMQQNVAFFIELLERGWESLSAWLTAVFAPIRAMLPG